MYKNLLCRRVVVIQSLLLMCSLWNLKPMGGSKDEPKLFTSQPSYRVTVEFKDGSKKDLKSIHYNGKPELPNVYLVCREGDERVGAQDKAIAKKRKTSIKATIAFKNIREMRFEKFSDTNVKAHIVSSRDGQTEEYRIPSDIRLKAESDISTVELDLTRIDKIVFHGMGTRKSTSTPAEEKARKERLFRPAIQKSLDKMKPQKSLENNSEAASVAKDLALEAKVESILGK